MNDNNFEYKTLIPKTIFTNKSELFKNPLNVTKLFIKSDGKLPVYCKSEVYKFGDVELDVDLKITKRIEKAVVDDKGILYTLYIESIKNYTSKSLVMKITGILFLGCDAYNFMFLYDAEGNLERAYLNDEYCENMNFVPDEYLSLSREHLIQMMNNIE